MFPNIPNDVLRLIIDHLVPNNIRDDYKTFQSCLLVNKQWYYVAFRLIYKVPIKFSEIVKLAEHDKRLSKLGYPFEPGRIITIEPITNGEIVLALGGGIGQTHMHFATKGKDRYYEQILKMFAIDLEYHCIYRNIEYTPSQIIYDAIMETRGLDPYEQNDNLRDMCIFEMHERANYDIFITEMHYNAVEHHMASNQCTNESICKMICYLSHYPHCETNCCSKFVKEFRLIPKEKRKEYFIEAHGPQYYD